MKKISICLLIMIFAGCSNVVSDPNLKSTKDSWKLHDGEILVTGQIQYADMEGGFFYIAGEDGQNYDPINLGDEYKITGMDVAFVAIVRNDLASIHMFGILIEIVRTAR